MAATTGTGDSPQPLRKDAARNRVALLTAARELFDERGLEVTLDEVARRAGVGVGTAYRHFTNKYELAYALLAESVEQMLTAAELAASRADGRAGLEEFMDVTIRPQAAQRALRAMLVSAPASRPITDVHARIEACMDTLVARGHEQGTLRADVTSTDLAVLSSLLGALIDIYGGIAPELWRRFVPLFLAGLRAGEHDPLPVRALDREEFLAAMFRLKGA